MREVKLDPTAERDSELRLTEEKYDEYQTSNGQLQWVVVTRPEVGFHTSTCASHAHNPTLTAAKCLNKTVKFLKETAHRQRIIPTLDMKTWRNVVYADASLGDVENAKTQGGRAVNLEDAHGKCSTLICRSGKLHRVAQSSFDAETLIAVHHLQGTKNPVDPLTKSLPFNAPTMQIFEEMLTGKAPEKN